MNIKQFLEQTGGQWFSQRTTYNLDQEESQVENSKADLSIEILPADHPQTINLCQTNSVDPNLILGAIATSWDNSSDWGKPKQKGSSLIALVADEHDARRGQILRIISQPEQKIIVGNYILGSDEALTLTLEQDHNCVEERIWFGSPNLRMRTIINKHQNQCVMTSFYSEIKKVAHN